MKAAHVAPYGKGSEAWERVLDVFCGTHEYKHYVARQPTTQPKPRTMTQRFAMLIQDRRTEEKETRKSSGIAEEYGER